uniref:Uncharacterized protein n=1 Tax=Onchocerca volvulus TaxID=6282 RepID=A0A8R1TVS8_ONCVO
MSINKVNNISQLDKTWWYISSQNVQLREKIYVLTECIYLISSVTSNAVKSIYCVQISYHPASRNPKQQLDCLIFIILHFNKATQKMVNLMTQTAFAFS